MHRTAHIKTQTHQKGIKYVTEMEKQRKAIRRKVN